MNVFFGRYPAGLSDYGIVDYFYQPRDADRTCKYDYPNYDRHPRTEEPGPVVIRSDDPPPLSAQDGDLVARQCTQNTRRREDFESSLDACAPNIEGQPNENQGTNERGGRITCHRSEKNRRLILWVFHRSRLLAPDSETIRVLD